MNSFLKKWPPTSTIFLFFLFVILACNKSEPDIQAPSNIILSNNQIYEKLPSGMNVASLSTDINDDDIKYRLVSGEGGEDNSQFELKGNILRSLTSFNYADGGSRSIRIQANLGEGSYEQAVSITINEFTGTYPSISSPSFENNTLMPRNFGSNNGNVSPDLEILNIPSQTQSMLLTMNDLDDNGSFHWAVWNIPADKGNITKGQQWGQGVVEGDNSFGSGYTGPFPPSQHRYETAVYFLDSKLDVPSDKYFQLLTTIPGKVIAKASIIGLYKP